MNTRDERGREPGSVKQRWYKQPLLLARAGCAAVSALVTGLFVITLPGYFAQLHQSCAPNGCNYGQLTAEGVKSLREAGISLQAYAAFLVALLVLSAMWCLAIALLILWRASENWSGVLVAFLLVILGVTSTTIDVPVLAPVLGSGLAAFTANFLNFLGAASLPLLISTFPNGRFVPRWSQWVVMLVLIVAVFITVVVPFVPSAPSLLATLVSFVYVACVLGLVVAQIYRYRRVSSPEEQQKTKWVVLGFSIAAVITVGLLLPTYLLLPFGRPGSPYAIFATLATSVSLTLPIALSFGIAILRHRLYDVDVLMNRTLVYGSVTAILAAIYVAGIIGVQAVVAVVSGHLLSETQTPVVVVASTLAVATLFGPLRRRLQSGIDRRFYRSKYDAARVLAGFSETLRSELDLDQLSERLVGVVHETMQPSYLSLWLRPAETSNEWNARQPAPGHPEAKDHDHGRPGNSA